MTYKKKERKNKPILSLDYLRGNKEISINKNRSSKRILDFKGLCESVKYKHTRPLKCIDKTPLNVDK